MLLNVAIQNNPRFATLKAPMRKDCIIRGRVQEQSLYRLKHELFIALIRNISNRVFLRLCTRVHQNVQIIR